MFSENQIDIQMQLVRHKLDVGDMSESELRTFAISELYRKKISRLESVLIKIKKLTDEATALIAEVNLK